MAEAIATVLMEQLVSIGRLKIEEEVNFLVGVEKEVESLTRTLNFIRALLKDAEKRQATEEVIKFWLESLKESMYDAEDVLEEWFTKISISQSKSQQRGIADDNSVVSGKVRFYLSSLCSCFQPVSILHKHKIASAIKDIREKLVVIASEKDQFKLTENYSYQEYSPVITSSIIDVSEICGRELDKDILMGKLVGESSTPEPHIPIIAIVGMGGLGKTTLAQLIYDEIKSSFEMSIWVCVSDPFKLHKVAKEIIEQTPGGKGHDFDGWESLHQFLSGAVKGKKYLLVLDDVWSEDYKVWDPLKISLNGGAQGSKIILTTRNEGVAKMMGSSLHDIHNLGMLSDDDSWLLFWRIASLGRRQEELQKLEEIGKEIAKKCKGLPLAVKTIASLMRSQRTVDDWKLVLASDIWDVKLVEKNILPALWLSYYALPPHLKQCFTYCAIFPKDTVLYKDDLVKRWMAQGFLGYDGSKELEMVGANYFEDLAARSFFQDIKRPDYTSGDGVECKMHDLVHDLALFLSGKGFRHIDAGKKVMELSFKSKNIRSLKIMPSKQVLLKLCSELRYLRLLELRYIKEVPNKVDRLFHLRYLDLSDNDRLKKLPETMCDLYHLQTLKLNKCRRLRKLPQGVGKLSNLRHIEVKSTYALAEFPRGIGRLHQLRELSKFPVSGASKGCGGLDELENLNYLQGSLEIEGLGNVESINEVKRAELRKKKNLVGLKLKFGSEDEMDMKRMEVVLECLQPDESLKDLKIEDFPGVTFPFWMCGSLLCSVVSLSLSQCKNCIQLPALGSLGSLEILIVEGLESVRHIGAELYGVGTEISFPKLKELRLFSMKNLGVWEILSSHFKQVMPRLAGLHLRNCPELMRLPGIERLEYLCTLQIEECQKLRASLEALGKLKSLENIFLRDVGVDGGNGELLCPKLRELKLYKLAEWEGTAVISASNSIFTPNLEKLKILECEKLKAVPHYMFSPSLKSLRLSDCPQLTEGMQPPLPLQLERLSLYGDVGMFSKSLLSVLITGNSTSYSNLRFVEIYRSRHSSLPQGLDRFTSLQELNIRRCELLDLKPEEELRHFPMLQKLYIHNSPVVEERCEREDWSTLSDIPYTIIINWTEITKRRRLVG